MFVLKSGKIITGAKLSRQEQQALQLEIRKQLAEHNKKNAVEVDSTILWALHEELGWGEKRLRRFFDRMQADMDRLVERYEMESGDGAWLCTQKLKEIGCDVHAWYEEEHLWDEPSDQNKGKDVQSNG